MRKRPIVVLTNRRDLAADDVIRRIDEQEVSVVRLNIEDVTSYRSLSWHPTGPTTLEPGCVWWRQFELARCDGHDMAAADELLVVRAQWRAWLACFYDSSVPWINDLWAAKRAEHKVEQLRVASRVGFAIPETVVTNDLMQARKLGSDSTLVVKTLASAYFELSDEAFVYTRPLSDATFADPTLWNMQPLIVQRKVEGRDVRVIALQGQFFGASCHTDMSDWRLAPPEDTEWRVWDVPSSVADCCRAYMKAFGLRYAAFDFIDDGSDVWFLEANQAGEWAFIDRSLSLGIAGELASALVTLTKSE